MIAIIPMRTEPMESPGQFGGPLNFRDAARAVEEAAAEAERTAAKAGALIDLATEMLQAFRGMALLFLCGWPILLVQGVWDWFVGLFK